VDAAKLAQVAAGPDSRTNQHPANLDHRGRDFLTAPPVVMKTRSEPRGLGDRHARSRLDDRDHIDAPTVDAAPSPRFPRVTVSRTEAATGR